MTCFAVPHMGEKRRNKRYSKRLRVEYGESDFGQSSYTSNVSLSGAFVIASRLPKLSELLHLKVFDDNGRWFAMEAEIRWLREVAPALRQVQRGGFGVRFLLPNEITEQLLPQLRT